MVPAVSVEIDVKGGTEPLFNWRLTIRRHAEGKEFVSLVLGQARGYLTARQEAIDCCRRLAVAALRPSINGSVLTLKLKDEDFARQENPSGVNLSRGHTA